MQAVIHPQDRSFNYGDGIFTTIQVRDGKLMLWELHLQRLQFGASRLGFGDIDWPQLQFQAEAAISSAQQVVKVLISRGEGGRGYACEGIDSPRVYISSSALPDYSGLQRNGLILRTASLQLAVQPMLAGLKHNNRLEQVLLKQELAQSDADELLVLDQLGYVTEATAANIFFYKDNQWHSPTLSRAGVNGVMRQHIMQQINVTEVDWKHNVLSSVEAMFICNALMGIVPIRQFECQTLSLLPVQQLQQVVC